MFKGKLQSLIEQSSDNNNVDDDDDDDIEKMISVSMVINAITNNLNKLMFDDADYYRWIYIPFSFLIKSIKIQKKRTQNF